MNLFCNMTMFSEEIPEAINMSYIHQAYKFNCLKDQDSKIVRSHIPYYVCTILSSLKTQ